MMNGKNKEERNIKKEKCPFRLKNQGRTKKALPQFTNEMSLYSPKKKSFVERDLTLNSKNHSTV